MTKPAVPPPARSDAIEVEIDAMDLAEWESGQSTPQASDANLAELVRRTAATPEAGVRVAATRDRARTQIGAAPAAPAVPAVRPPGQVVRTAPPGPAPRPARGRTSAEGSAAPRAADAVPVAAQPAPPADPTRLARPIAAKSSAVAVPGMAPMPVPAPMPGATAMPAAALPKPAAMPGPSVLPNATPMPGLPPVPGHVARSTATPPGGIDFSLPVTATGESDSTRMPRSLPLPAPAPGLDFDLPVTATGDTTKSFEPYRPPGPAPALPAPPSAAAAASASGAPAPSGIDFAVPVTATSQSGARRPGSEPPASAITPTPAPSPFAEASHVGPGRNAVPPGSTESNTAWPPRQRPTEPWSRPDPAAPAPTIAPSPERVTSPEASPDASPGAAGNLAPGPGLDGAERLQVLSRRRLYGIAGAIGAIAIAAVVAAASFGSSDDAAAPAAEPRRGPTPSSAAAAARTPGDATGEDAREPDATSRTAGAGRSAPIDPAARAISAQQTWRLAIGAVEGLTDATVGPAPRPKHRTGPTRVVIDYRARPNEPLPVATAPTGDDDPAIESARGAYNRGNQRLFVGDLEGAVRAYRESLDLYPGYVGGYRGLGLAYAELGEKTAALDALQAYITAAPGARDVALIKKRIARLQSK